MSGSIGGAASVRQDLTARSAAALCVAEACVFGCVVVTEALLAITMPAVEPAAGPCLGFSAGTAEPVLA